MIEIKSNPVNIAKYFISISERDLTPLQIIKFSYIAYGTLLGQYEIKLFDEQIQAWQYGPVINSIYQEFKKYGRNVIPKQDFEKYNSFDDYLSINEQSSSFKDNKNTIEKVLDETYQTYKDLGGYTLIDLTHAVGTPWDKCQSYSTIDDNTISEHYANINNLTSH